LAARLRPSQQKEGGIMTIERVPIIVVKRRFYDQFASGEKTIEYRRHRPPFTIRVFYPERRVRIAYTYNLSMRPHLDAVVRSFDVALLSAYPRLREIYPDMEFDDELALIALDIFRNSA
jgi:hypothetical protein